MATPIVIAYHLVWTVYGNWHPNDPRGSMSKVIRNNVLRDLGEIHFGRKRIQPASRDLRAFDAQAAQRLCFPVLDFSPSDVAAVAEAFARTIALHRYTCYACAIMPDHVHVLTRKHRHVAEQMIANLQRESHILLRERRLRDMEHPVWGGRGWKVFLDHPSDIRRTIGYIVRNPDAIGLPRQTHPFVTLYDGWPLHPGHNPSSPYARRMTRS
jgi:REP element-mobilizing transposase RayT